MEWLGRICGLISGCGSFLFVFNVVCLRVKLNTRYEYGLANEDKNKPQTKDRPHFQVIKVSSKFY